MNATTLARAVVASLLGAGVREAVLAPGSRNAPFAFATHAADAAGLLRLHVRIDERDAAFLALGLAKSTGRPVPVITTSGTAVANLTPAVWEAAHAGVPLVVLSADRPLDHLDAGVNQATRHDQAFGRFVRADTRLETGIGDEATVRHQVHRLLARATGRVGADPGPVHCNVGFASPLVPDDTWTPTPGSQIAIAAAPVPEPEHLVAGPRTVLLVGDTDPATGRAAHAAAREAGIPVLAEPSSNARLPGAIATYRLLLGTELGGRIERVVVVGRPTLSRPVSGLLARDDVEVIVANTRGDWPDPGHRVGRVVAGVDFAPGDPAWAADWADADQRLGAAVTEHLTGLGHLDGHTLAALVVEHTRGNLMFGASQLIRDADLAPIVDEPATVWANRGLAGIDGTISTAAGIALGTATPTTVLLGDITALHDAGGLLIGPSEPRPNLRLVIGNDDGGSIFHILEQGAPAHAAVFERTFATPHRVDLAALAAAYGWTHRCEDTAEGITDALASDPSGTEMVEVRLRRDHRRDLAAALTALAR
ncbi:2-succinyl-5-enolpyruvyl-6-hydroxy-3-cyclohexene-1-carboxylic-acid synthase [Enemella sp. A6]|uniref:2-succinyl-5-enolpyruvyl-6-hydroxy-3- cyclohexene-1-carboxylic-acid synthase n=1 Tax=Enemella sp. A6 TaxID=3440152 RepID=UPI003EB96858